MLKLTPAAVSQQLPQGIGSQTVFGLLLGNVQFQQHVNGATAPRGLLVNLLQQLQRVNGFYHRNVRGNILHLVSLQVADEMPADVLGQRRHLVTKLLLVALAEDALTLSVGSLDILVRMVLADSHKAYTLRQIGQHQLQMFLYVVIHSFTELQIPAWRLPPYSCHTRRHPSA